MNPPAAKELSSREVSHSAGSLAKPSLCHSLLVQCRVIEAIVLREIRTRFWRNRLGYIWAVLEPVLGTMVWLYLLIVVRGRGNVASDISPLLMLSTGIISYYSFNKVSGYLQGAISGNRGLLQYPMVKHVDLLIARFILESSTMLFVATVFFGGMTAFELEAPPADIGFCLMAMFSLFGFGFAYGSFNAFAAILSPTYEKIIAIVNRVLFLLSGVLFLGETLPPHVLKILAYNPIFGGIELFRTGYISHYQSSVATFSYIWFCSGILTLGALILERTTREKLQDI